MITSSPIYRHSNITDAFGRFFAYYGLHFTAASGFLFSFFFQYDHTKMSLTVYPYSEDLDRVVNLRNGIRVFSFRRGVDFVISNFPPYSYTG